MNNTDTFGRQEVIELLSNILAVHGHVVCGKRCPSIDDDVNRLLAAYNKAIVRELTKAHEQGNDGAVASYIEERLWELRRGA